ncbi:hypothetical protein AAMO2058_000082800 [Amorphochlora amoebiformis]
MGHRAATLKLKSKSDQLREITIEIKKVANKLPFLSKNELIHWGGIVKEWKRNRLRQRVILLTNLAVYNLSVAQLNRCRRPIRLKHIPKIVVARGLDEMVIYSRRAVICILTPPKLNIKIARLIDSLSPSGCLIEHIYTGGLFNHTDPVRTTLNSDPASGRPTQAFRRMRKAHADKKRSRRNRRSQSLADFIAPNHKNDRADFLRQLTSNLPLVQLLKLQKIYADLCDKSEDHRLNTETLTEFFRSRKDYRINSSIVSRIMTLFDEDNDGMMDVNEFVAAMGMLVKGGSTSDHIEFCFHIFDDDRDGVLDRQEFSNMMKATLTARLSSLLTHPIGEMYFTEHLIAEHSQENIEFWRKMQNIEKIPDQREFERKILAMYEKYIKVTGESSLNLSHRTRKIIHRKIAERMEDPKMIIPRDIYDKANHEVLRMMDTMCFQRFLRKEAKIDGMLDLMFQEADCDGDGLLTLDEFKHFAFRVPETINFIGTLEQDTLGGLGNQSLAQCLKEGDEASGNESKSRSSSRLSREASKKLFGKGQERARNRYNEKRRLIWEMEEIKAEIERESEEGASQQELNILTKKMALLANTITSTGFSRQEWLHSRPTFGKRWFKMDKKSRRLEYYSDSKLQKKNGSFSISDLKLVSRRRKRTESGYDAEIEISTSDNRFLILRTDSPTDAKQWIDSIKQADRDPTADVPTPPPLKLAVMDDRGIVPSISTDTKPTHPDEKKTYLKHSTTHGDRVVKVSGLGILRGTTSNVMPLTPPSRKSKSSQREPTTATLGLKVKSPKSSIGGLTSTSARSAGNDLLSLNSDNVDIDNSSEQDPTPTPTTIARNPPNA